MPFTLQAFYNHCFVAYSCAAVEKISRIARAAILHLVKGRTRSFTSKLYPPPKKVDGLN